LWPEMLRAIREIQPRWVVGENVFGLINWSDGLVFHEVQTDLEAAGYEVWPYVLPACAVNAPHRRDRVWFVAYCNGSRLQEARPKQQTTRFEQYGELDGDVTDTDSKGLEGGAGQVKGWSNNGFAGNSKQGSWENFPTQSPICTRNDGLPAELDGITFPKWRNESIKAAGNAIVPQVALQIFKAIEQYGQQNS